jgi:hypothetical protein
VTDAANGARFHDLLVETSDLYAIDSTGIFTKGKGSVYPHSPGWDAIKFTGVHIYNNVFVIPAHLSPQILWETHARTSTNFTGPQRYAFDNNVVYNLSPTATYNLNPNVGSKRQTTRVMRNNCFFGQHPAGEPLAVATARFPEAPTQSPRGFRLPEDHRGGANVVPDLQVSPDSAAVRSILLVKHLLHLRLFGQYDPLVNRNHVHGGHEQYRIQGTQDRRTERGIHAHVHGIPAEPVEPVLLQAGAFFRRSDSEGVSEAGSAAEQEREAEDPQAERYVLAQIGDVHKGEIAPPGLDDHRAPHNDDGVLAAHEERLGDRRLSVHVDTAAVKRPRLPNEAR